VVTIDTPVSGIRERDYRNGILEQADILPPRETAKKWKLPED